MNEKPNFIFEDILFGQMDSPRKPQYEGYDSQSVYVPMSDGVKLAVDIFLPKGMGTEDKIPALIYRTRYWRDAELKEPSNQPDMIVSFFTSYGYAVIRMDVRGTGASFGTMVHEWQPQDIKDTYEIVDWIISQKWSNSKVGSYGVSYPGTTAELLAATKHPAVTSIWATYHELDGYTDIAFPGGIPSRFIPAWSEMTTALDNNTYPDETAPIIGVKPVDNDPERKLLLQAVEEHKSNNHVGELCEGLIYRDDPMNIIGSQFDDMMVYPKRQVIEESNVPLDIWGSWMDANTADTVIRHFATFKNPMRGVISAWSHGGGSFHSPYMPPDTPLEIDRKSQLHEILRYMDQQFHGVDSRLPEKILFYYTMGEEKWKSTTTWPPENSTARKLYLNSSNTLLANQPDASGSETYEVDFEITSGKQNRWWTEMGGGPIIYTDRTEADKKLLVFDSQPMSEDTEVTGYPLISLYVSSSETDGAFFIYLEDIDPNGKATYMTEGMLRALHRKVSNEEPPYRVFGPYHSYKRKDGSPMAPGKVEKLEFALMPVSAMVKKGHQIRIAIACADQDTFENIPENSKPVVQIHFGGNYPACIELPIIDR